MSHQYERTDVRQRQIAGAALELIAEGGLKAFTTRTIAERVGITDGTIFRHFKSKSEIMHAALDHLEELMFGGDEEAIEDPLARLEAFLRARFKLVASPHGVGRLVFSEQIMHAAGESGRERIRGWRDRNVALVLGCLEGLRSEGRLRPGLAPQALVPFVQGLLLVTMLESTFCGGEIPNLEARIESAWSTLTALLLEPAGP